MGNGSSSRKKERAPTLHRYRSPWGTNAPQSLLPGIAAVGLLFLQRLSYRRKAWRLRRQRKRPRRRWHNTDHAIQWISQHQGNHRCGKGMPSCNDGRRLSRFPMFAVSGFPFAPDNSWAWAVRRSLLPRSGSAFV